MHHSLNSRLKKADDAAIERMKEAQQPMGLTDQSPMPFGIHKGKKMEDVPAKYLLWLRTEGCRNPEVAAYIEDNLTALCKEHPDYIP